MYWVFRSSLFVAVVVGVAVCACAQASATTFVMADTADLFAAADTVVVGYVTAIDDAGPDSQPRTNVRIAVEEVVKGTAASEITVVEPGGRGVTRWRWVHGAPRFFVGEHVLLFLARNQRQELETLFLAMGKFGIVHVPGELDFAVRNLADARTLSAKRGRLEASPSVTAYPLQKLIPALRAFARGASAPVTDGVGAQENFTFAGPPLARWFQPDSSEPISYEISREGDVALGRDASVQAANAALAAWNSASCSNLHLVDAGAADATPFGECDGHTQITFNDPFDEIADPVNCAGVLALGGVCGSSTVPEDFNGASFSRITEGDVVVNNGFGNCAFWNTQNVAELLTHEVGHTLGLAHSSDDPDESDPSLREATMYFAAHFDGRGAVLASDDVAAVCALYPAPRAASMVLRRFAIVSDPARPAPSDRLVVDGIFDLSGRSFDALNDTFIFDLRVAGASVFRLAVVPGQWMPSASGTRFRYRGVTGTGTAVLTLSTRDPGTVRLSLQAHGLDLSGADADSIVLSLAVGQAVVTETAAASRFMARSQAVPEP
jgi:hypothetical protein